MLALLLFIPTPTPLKRFTVAAADRKAEYEARLPLDAGYPRLEGVRSLAIIRSSRKIERAGVNALRTLLEDHDQIVQEIDGGNDHGEDLIVFFSRRRKRTGHVISVQVKAGEKYKRKNGYAIPVESHFFEWKNSKIPVIGVVFDPKTKCLYWTNLTRYLNKCEVSPGWVQIPATQELNSEKIRGFMAEMEMYIDQNGMRVRNKSFEGEVRSESLHPKLGEGGSDIPNPLFEELVNVIEKPLKFTHRRWREIVPLAIIALMAWEWPYQVEFVKTYTDESPTVWILNIYFFMIFLMIIIYTERLAGRFAEHTLRWFSLISGNFLWIPFIKGDGKNDQWWGDTWITVGAIFPHFGYVIAISFFGTETFRIPFS